MSQRRSQLNPFFATAFLILSCITAMVSLRGEVADITLRSLATSSDTIVVVKVTKIEPAADDISDVGDEYPPVRVATARVLETWKGPDVKEVQFVATPTEFCDISSAKEGETLVLFLDRRNRQPMHIAHVGRGRMAVRNIQGKSYATLADEVKAPGGVSILTKSEGKEKVRLLELRTLRGLVRDYVPQRRDTK